MVRLTQQLGGGVSEQRTIALRDDLMTFQGVLLFIVDRRVDLQRGQTLTAQWIVPSRMTSYGLRIYKRALQGNLLTVRLELSSVAFRFFSTPSDLTIDVASGRVLEFAGPSNLLDDKDKPVRVRIVYEYPSAVSTSVQRRGGCRRSCPSVSARAALAEAFRARRSASVGDFGAGDAARERVVQAVGVRGE